MSVMAVCNAWPLLQLYPTGWVMQGRLTERRAKIAEIELRARPGDLLKESGNRYFQEIARKTRNCGVRWVISLRPEGVERPPQNIGKTPVFQTGGANSGALSPDFVEIDPDLQRIVNAWPTLPEAMRAGILAMIAASSK
jgi:hypothetical protein